MAFRIKDFLQITSGMIAHMRAVSIQLTDFNIGSVARTMVEAPAVEIDELYQAFAQGLVEAIPTVLYQSFDFPLLDAAAASGYLRISVPTPRTSPLTFPMGALVGTATGVQYRLATAATIQTGGTWVEVIAVCTQPGAVGNAAPGTITRLISSGSGLASVTNPLAFQNGRGSETKAERKLRFGEFIQTLAGGTIRAVQIAAKAATVVDANGVTIERVARTKVEETPGHVVCWMHNGVGSTSAALLARAVELVEGYADANTGELKPGKRPTGMRVDVRIMREIPVDVSLLVQAPLALRTDATKEQIKAVVAGVIRAVASGDRLLPLDLENAPLALAGVVLGVQIEAPLLVIPCPINSVLVPGALEVRWA